MRVCTASEPLLIDKPSAGHECPEQQLAQRCMFATAKSLFVNMAHTNIYTTWPKLGDGTPYAQLRAALIWIW